MPGAAWHEHEAGECRWPGSADGRAAIEATELGAAEYEIPRSLRRFTSPHQRRSDQEAIDQRGQGFEAGTAVDAGLGDQAPVGRRRSQPLRSGQVDLKIAKVAIIDPDQRRAECQ